MMNACDDRLDGGNATGKGESCGHEQRGSQGQKTSTMEAAFRNNDSSKASKLRLWCRG